MAYTFGTTTGDDINFSSDMTQVGSNRATFVFGWWRPTTLTATRGLWSVGNTAGAEIDTTTDELRLRTDNTTDGEWTTSGVDLVVNEWTYLAFFVSLDSTSGGVWKVWRGTQDVPPTEATVTVAVARSGNFTGNTVMYLGNKGTATLAFQGDIQGVGFVGTTYTGGHQMFHLPSHGTALTTEVSDLLYSEHVLPSWRVGIDYIHANSRLTVSGAGAPQTVALWAPLGPSPGAANNVAYRVWAAGNVAASSPIANLVAGSSVSVSSERGPRERHAGDELRRPYGPHLANPL